MREIDDEADKYTRNYFKKIKYGHVTSFYDELWNRYAQAFF